VKAFCSERINIRLSKPGYFHADGEIFECGEEIAIVSHPKSPLMALPSDTFARRNSIFSSNRIGRLTK